MKINELQLQARDLASQHDFYATLLSLPLLASQTDTLTLGAGSSRLVFRQAPAGWNGTYHFAFNVPEERFKEAKEWVSQRVPLLKNNSGQDEFNFEAWNAHALYFYDPSGNIVEFIARHDLAEYPDPGPFSGRSILSVSEIGLATDDVPGTVQFITRRTGVDVYDGVGSDAFTAVGDIHGLFIVVKSGRIWFPDTGKAAGQLPLAVTVTSAAGARYVLAGPPYEISAAP